VLVNNVLKFLPTRFAFSVGGASPQKVGTHRNDCGEYLNWFCCWANGIIVILWGGPVYSKWVFLLVNWFSIVPQKSTYPAVLKKCKQTKIIEKVQPV
jgi:hypothetical protein